MSKKVLVVVTGSVASLKTPILVRLLKKNGYLVIMVPAFQYLYSDYDKSIGHFSYFLLDSWCFLDQFVC